MQEAFNNLLKHKPGFIIAFLIISISVCNGQKDYHLINVLPVTFHDNENQLHLATAIGMGTGVDLAISYSVNEEFAVFATGNMNIWSRTKLNILSLASDYKVEKNDYAITGGLMRFKNYDNKLLESYVGYGFAEVDNYWHFVSRTDPRDFVVAKYSSLFFQTNFGWIFEPFAFGPTGQISCSYYHDFLHIDNKGVQTRYDNRIILSLDIGLFMSYSFNGLNINMQIGSALPISMFNVNDFDEARDTGDFIKVGFHYNFN